MKTNRSKRRGISLMIVTAVVAVAAVMGIAILSSNTLQAEASANQDQVLKADAMAESGVNLGLYYLQNLTDSTKCPAAIASLTIAPAAGSSYTRNNVNLGGSVSGTFDLKIDRISTIRYQITATGRPAASSTLTKKLVVVADLNYYGYGLIAPNPTSGNLTIPANTTVYGNVYASIPVINNGTVNGTIYTAASSGGSGGGLLGLVLGLVESLLVPDTGSVNHYLTYTYNGGTYSAGLILLGSVSNVTYGPTGGNPAGVYYHIGTLDLNGNVVVNGTLVVNTGGSLRVAGTGNVITPVQGFPAVVVDGDISFKANNAVLNLLGLSYTGGRIVRTGAWTGTTLNVTGSLLFASTTIVIDSGITVKLTYDRYKSAVMTLGGSTPGPTSISIISWTNQ